MEKRSTTLYRYWYRRRNAAIIGAVSLVFAYAIGSRAIDTGSLQQYALTILFVGLGINRLVHGLRKH